MRMEVCVGEERLTLEAQEGETLYSALVRASRMPEAPCGGRCFCGKCRVRIENPGEPAAADRDWLTQKELEAGWRLACATKARDGLRVALETRREAAILTEGLAVTGDLDPSVCCVPVEMTPPSLSDPMDDLSRLCAAVGAPGAEAPLETLCALPGALRAGQWRTCARILRGDEPGCDALLDVGRDGLYGLAIDVGTTTIAAYLLDLHTGTQIDVESMLNPQAAFGGDVIARSDAASGAQGMARVCGAVRGALSDIVERLSRRNGVDREDILHVVLAGNPIMMHLYLGVTTANIAVSPFVPAFCRGIRVEAREVNLPVHLRARVELLPGVAGYVGADTVAAALSCRMHEGDGLSLLIDIGTNGEIVLGGADGMVCCSTAAGPAFEGAHIACGLGGVAGAVSRVWPAGEGLDFETLSGAAPVGICGSGLVDMVACMLEAGWMDEMGRIDADAVPESLRHEVDGKAAIWISRAAVHGGRDVYITQKDVREVQLAKAAIAAGVRVLLGERNAGPADVRTLYLAGGFGNYIDLDSACRIGLLPRELRGRIQPIGNGAGVGCKRVLVSREAGRTAASIAGAMRYVELSMRMDFQDAFVDEMVFPEVGM